MSASDQRITLQQFVISEWQKTGQNDGLGAVIMAIANGSVRVQQQVQQAALADALGTTGETNVQGEIVQRLDAASSDIFVETLSQSGHVAAIGCEEIERPVIVAGEVANGYIVLMDPLDGSSNIDVAVSIGSIFGIWLKSPGETVNDDSLLRSGNQQVAAAYVVYGSSTVLVLATKDSVQGFTLDSESDSFIMTHPNIKIPADCPYYSTNEGNNKVLDESTQKAITLLRDKYSQRYVGSLVADFHRNLLKGGIFAYPADTNRKEGRLRLMYEANPLGYVAEQAGGAASTGYERIMDVIPKELHQRTPLILGNKDVVDETVSVISGG
ncbi:MAG: class 1 fructose-bisphosphatase [Chloroflexota bacterium]|nr:fructose-1,6-bisphosphatase [Dehalococcoidia bacterium]MEC8910994.1 class 1 fructose-bisphosphatase [Chloroflexota bacterium]